jgi:hypothetical protein
MNSLSQVTEHNTPSYEHSPHLVTVTHPYHPLKGQKLEVIHVIRGSGVVVRLNDRKSLRLPLDYTDYAPSDHSEGQTSSSHITHLHSADALREIIKFIKQIALRSESQE